MNNKPQWLPNIICVDGNFNEVTCRLYSIFYKDFIAGYPKLRCMDVWYNKKILQGGTYEEGFWHLIERDHNKQGNRSFDSRRAERLPWCAPVLNNSYDPEILYWTNDEHGKITLYVWLKNYDYIIILEKRTLPPKSVNGIEKPARTIAFLKTAYHLDGDSQKRYFSGKFEEFNKMQSPPQ